MINDQKFVRFMVFNLFYGSIATPTQDNQAYDKGHFKLSRTPHREDPSRLTIKSRHH